VSWQQAAILAFVAFLLFCAAAVLRSTTSRCVLPDELQERLRSMPLRRRNQHLVDLVLDDGSTVSKVYVAYGRFVVQPLFRRRIDAWRIVDLRNVDHKR
jgi:hypothetical protein